MLRTTRRAAGLVIMVAGCRSSAPTSGIPATSAPSIATPIATTPAPLAAPAPALDCSADGWCLENPTPWHLAGVELWGSARDDVWVAGNAGLILHYDGKSWSRASGIKKANLYAITGTARNDVWAVGYVGEALHWDGASWTSQRVSTADLLSDVGTDDAGRVWTASANAVWTRDGSTWKQAAKLECPADMCLAPKLRSASGGRLLVMPRDRTWDGTKVVTDRPPPDRKFGGTRASTIWGWLGGRSFIQRWDGKRWIAIDVPGGIDVHAIWGATDTDVWMVGNAGAILRWDGTRFATVDSRTTGDFDAVWGSAADDVWIAGEGGLLHWNGTALSSITATVSTANLEDVWGTSDCDVWAVGERGTVLRRGCASWTAIASGITTSLHGVGGSGPDDVWLVGDDGVILHWNGRTLAATTSPTLVALRAVWAASPREAWAVGDAGTIVRWDGKAWATVTSPSKTALLRLDGTGPRNVVAAGVGGTVLEWDGVQWAETRKPLYCIAHSGAPDTHTGVALTRSGDLVVTCRGSGVMHRSAGTWSSPPGTAGRAATYSDIVAHGDELAVSGWYGTIVAQRGSGWAVEATRVAQPLSAVWISPTGTTWAVGFQGTILSHSAVQR